MEALITYLLAQATINPAQRDVGTLAALCRRWVGEEPFAPNPSCMAILRAEALDVTPQPKGNVSPLALKRVKDHAVAMAATGDLDLAIALERLVSAAEKRRR